MKLKAMCNDSYLERNLEILVVESGNGPGRVGWDPRGVLWIFLDRDVALALRPLPYTRPYSAAFCDPILD